MDIALTNEEIRVLGCLIEKEMATPDYYPLTLNSLINACNQKSNRNPVVNYDEETVDTALNKLRGENLVRKSNVSRVPKYEQLFSSSLNLINRETAVICILLVRGPQTVGEIRNRTERLYAFKDLDEVQLSLSSLEEMDLVARLPRAPGRKESRYTHLLGENSLESLEEVDHFTQTGEVGKQKEADRIRSLEDEVNRLRQELEYLQRSFEAFKSQFE